MSNSISWQTIIRKIHRRLFRSRLEVQGPYESWDVASKTCSGYSHAVILKKVSISTESVLSGSSIYERDGTNFNNRPPLNRIEKFILDNIDNFNSIIDYGGGLGGLYYNNPSLLRLDKYLAVVEQPSFVLEGRRIASRYNTGVHFCNNILHCRSPVDIVIFSSVLQYLPSVESIVKDVLQLGPKYIILDRTAIDSQMCNSWWIQIEKTYYDEPMSYPIRPLSLNKLSTIFSPYKIIESWASHCDPEIPSHRGFLLQMPIS
jgi:putative methyltransferase (TIGR04325 family)